MCSCILIMKARCFDDLKVGDRFKSEPLRVTERKLIEFAHKFDPQMFHLSRKGAERTIFKGLVASGWHTAARLCKRCWPAQLCEGASSKEQRAKRQAASVETRTDDCTSPSLNNMSREL